MSNGVWAFSFSQTRFTFLNTSRTKRTFSRVFGMVAGNARIVRSAVLLHFTHQGVANGCVFDVFIVQF